MKVILKTQYCGPKGSFKPGSVIDVEENEAEQLVEGGYAIPSFNAVPKEQKVEVAEAKPEMEIADEPKAKKRRPRK